MSKVNKFLYFFFWFAFASFLTASISHVAYFFRAFEPQTDGRDLLWWVVSYAIALSIDVTMFLLSITVANMHRKHRPGSLIFTVWLFVLGLVALSFYFNAKYAQHFADTAMISPTVLDLPWLGTIGDVNPYLASMFQILAIAYTWISDKIVSDDKPISVEELKIQAQELAEKATYEKQIADLKRGRTHEKTEGATSTAIAFLQAGKTIAKAAFKRGQNETIEPGISELNEGQNESQNESIDEAKPEVKSPDRESQTSPQIALTSDLLPVLNAYPKLASLLSTGRKTVTINEISNVLDQSVRTVSNRVKSGVLKHAPRNEKLILITSVLDWSKTLLIESQNGSKTSALPVVKLVHNGHIDGAITDDLSPVITDDRVS